jgi:hypothetical protein
MWLRTHLIIKSVAQELGMDLISQAPGFVFSNRKMGFVFLQSGIIIWFLEDL